VETATPRTGLLRGPVAYAPKTPWSPLGAVAAAVAIILVGILAAALFLGSTTLQGLFPSVSLFDRETAVLATLGLWQAVTILLTLAASRLFGGRARDVLALGPPAATPLVYLKALLSLVLLQVMVSVVQYGAGSADRFADLRPMVQLIGGPQWLLALTVIGVGAPLSEELLFRGFLFSALARRLGLAGAGLATSLAWTALHYGYTAMGLIEVFLIGLLFAWLLARTGSLRVAIFCHALYNSVIVLVLRYVPLPA
jgi:membrane protease YdiL (CAAX protease family)